MSDCACGKATNLMGDTHSEHGCKSFRDGRMTHTATCWKVHHVCAIAEVERLTAELAEKDWLLAWWVEHGMMFARRIASALTVCDRVEANPGQDMFSAGARRAVAATIRDALRGESDE